MNTASRYDPVSGATTDASTAQTRIMTTPTTTRRKHIVIVGHHDDETATVAREVARRLHRPLLDRTPATPSTATAANTDTPPAANAAALAWYTQTVATNDQYVVAAPTCLLDQTNPPTRPDATWTVYLDDETERRHRTNATTHDMTRRRHDTARRISDIRIDTSNHDTERITDQIAHAWHADHPPS